MLRSRLTRVMVIGGAAALAAGLVVPSALASSSPKFTVKAGSAKTGTKEAAKGKTTGKSPQVALKDKTSGTTLNCTSAGATATLTVGKNEKGAGIGTISGSGTTWTGCTGPQGIKLTPVGSGTWKLNATSYKKGVTTGSISDVKDTVSSSPASLCTFKVTGSVPVTYTNKTHELQVLPTKAGLTIGKVTGCFGQVNKGDKSTFAATYKLSKSVTITG